MKRRHFLKGVMGAVMLPLGGMPTIGATLAAAGPASSTDVVNYRDLVAYRKIKINQIVIWLRGGSYDFRTHVVTPPAGWHDYSPSHDPDEVVICSYAIAHNADGDVWHAGDHDWSYPFIVGCDETP